MGIEMGIEMVRCWESYSELVGQTEPSEFFQIGNLFNCAKPLSYLVFSLILFNILSLTMKVGGSSAVDVSRRL